MLVCDAPTFSTWRPDFSSSGQESPTWTRMSAHGIELANSIEHLAVGSPSYSQMHAPTDLAQVLVCEECGFVGCKVGDWVRIVRLGSWLLWVPSLPSTYPEAAGDVDEYRPPGYLRTRGAIVISEACWTVWRENQPLLPETGSYPAATRRDIAAAWLLEAPGGPQRIAAVRTQILPAAVAASVLSLEEALAAVETVVDWLDEPDPEPLAGRELRRAADVGARVETLYLDGLPEWKPVAYHAAAATPSLGGDLVLDPPPRVE